MRQITLVVAGQTIVTLPVASLSKRHAGSVFSSVIVPIAPADGNVHASPPMFVDVTVTGVPTPVLAATLYITITIDQTRTLVDALLMVRVTAAPDAPTAVCGFI